MRRIVVPGDTLDRLRGFPESARREAGMQLHKLQLGLDLAGRRLRTLTTGRGGA